MREFDASEITRVAVKLDDGSTWEAEYKDDRLLLIRQLDAPEAAPDDAPEARPKAPPKYIELSKPSPRPSPKPLPRPMMLIDDDREEKEQGEQAPVMEDSVFRAKLSNVMTDNMFDRRVRGRTRGRLDMTRLFKAETLASNVFTQKQARKNKNYNIVLLIDESGSMVEEDRIEEASKIAVFLAKVFDGLNLNLAIVGFNSYIGLHKGFDEKLPDLKKLGETIEEAVYSDSMGSGCNNDFEALSYAYKLFKGRQGQNFLIMLSDGQPAMCSHVKNVLEKGQAVLDKAIKEKAYWAISPKDLMGKQRKLWVNTESKLGFEARHGREHLNALVDSHKDVTSIGIGLQTDCWQVPDNIREDDMDRLKPVLLREIERKVKRG